MGQWRTPFSKLCRKLILGREITKRKNKRSDRSTSVVQNKEPFHKGHHNLRSLHKLKNANACKIFCIGMVNNATKNVIVGSR